MAVIVSDEPLDSRVTNGQFVDAEGSSRASMTIHDGRVVDGFDERDVWRTVNASGHLVLPGMIQPGNPTPDAALDLVRGGVTTVYGSDEFGDACVDVLGDVSAPIQTLAISADDGELSDADWGLILGTEPLHVSAPGLATFPLIQFLYQEGHLRRGLALARMVEITSAALARAAGVYPRKGSFAEGSDGDLFVFDPLTPDPYRENRWPGRVIFSLQRGNILLYNGQIHTSLGSGVLVSADGAR